MGNNKSQDSLIAEKYASAATSYLCAAEILWKQEKDTGVPIHLPIAQCMAHGLELYLKVLLLRRGYAHSDIMRFKHDIYKLWMLDDFEEIRAYSQSYAETSAAMKPPPFSDPYRESIDSTVKKLDHLYNKRSNFSLRYPVEELKIPYPQPLLWVLAKLVLDNPMQTSRSHLGDHQSES